MKVTMEDLCKTFRKSLDVPVADFELERALTFVFEAHLPSIISEAFWRGQHTENVLINDGKTTDDALAYAARIISSLTQPAEPEEKERPR